MKFTSSAFTNLEESNTGKTYKGFEIIKTWKEQGSFYGSSRQFFGGYATPLEYKRVSGSTRYYAIQREDIGHMETESFKTIKEVKAAIDAGDYWG